MRDIAVTLAVFGSLPFIFKRPWIGILVWTWLGFMNPHRMAWGFSTSMPFAQIVALATLTAMLMHRFEKRIPWERESVVLLLFVGWMLVTTIFAIYPSAAWHQFDKVIKIQLMIFVAMVLINTPERIKYLVWTIALSLAFYGVKGGIFTILRGGVFRVQGPPGTFIAGNNELGLALAMTVPLLYFLARHATHLSLRPLMYGVTMLTAIAAIGTQSRGAMLGMAVMGTMFWLKARQKFMVALLGGLSVLAIVAIMPPEWYERMSTIKTYEQDPSSMGRVNAWWTAFNLASSRLIGGGFETFRWQVFQLYAPDPSNVRDVHSIYFEVLGEHGFVGLFLFLLLALMTWRSAETIKKAVRGVQDRAWMGELSAMIQVSLIAYLASGTFLGMAYFDYYYNLILLVIALKAVLRKEGLLGAKKGPVPGPDVRSGLRPPSTAGKPPDQADSRASPRGGVGGVVRRRRAAEPIANP